VVGLREMMRGRYEIQIAMRIQVQKKLRGEMRRKWEYEERFQGW
jgi:hypothetical protein